MKNEEKPESLLAIPPLPDYKLKLEKAIPIEGIALPEPVEYFILLSYNPGFGTGYWKNMGIFETLAGAEKQVKDLSTVWRYHRIIQVTLP